MCFGHIWTVKTEQRAYQYSRSPRIYLHEKNSLTWKDLQAGFSLPYFHNTYATTFLHDTRYYCCNLNSVTMPRQYFKMVTMEI